MAEIRNEKHVDADRLYTAETMRIDSLTLASDSGILRS